MESYDRITFCSKRFWFVAVWFFQGIEKMKFVTLINVLAKVIFTVLVFIFIKSESDYLKVPIFNSLGFIVSC